MKRVYNVVSSVWVYSVQAVLNMLCPVVSVLSVIHLKKPRYNKNFMEETMRKLPLFSVWRGNSRMSVISFKEVVYDVVFNLVYNGKEAEKGKRLTT